MCSKQGKAVSFSENQGPNGVILSGIKPLILPIRKLTHGKWRDVLKMRKVNVGHEGKFPGHCALPPRTDL